MAGITPIYMGSMHGVLRRTGSGQDHPHIHGEHNFLTGVTK